MKKSLKKFLPLLFLLLLAATLTVGALSACTPAEEFPITFRDDVDVAKLEFVSGEFDKSRPTMIYFHGLMEAGERFSFLLPEEYKNVMDKDEASKPLFIKGHMEEYWKEQGWNLAVFHFEAETLQGESGFYQNLFAKDSGLLNQFINIFRIKYASAAATYQADYPLGVAQAVPEIRFCGEGVGAVFASYAAESVGKLVQNGKLSQYYLPWRLTLLNPALSNAAYAKEVQQNGSGVSPLRGVNRAIKNAFLTGNTVAELVESDIKYASSYATPYSAEDVGIYSEILAQVACLEINETFSITEEWSAKLKETVSRVWYIASIGGSDYDSTSGSSAPTTIKNLLPFINNPKENYSNTTSFSVSAWTPTAALRGLKGLRFRAADYNSSETPNYKERVTTKFRLELFQSSFLSQTKPRIGGYLFIDQNGDVYMNDGRKSMMRAGLPVTMRYTVQGSDETAVTVLTDIDGFYLFEVPKEAYGLAVYLNFDIPDYRYVFGGRDNSGKTYDEQCSMAVFNGASQYVSSSWRDQYNMIKNCGYCVAGIGKNN